MSKYFSRSVNRYRLSAIELEIKNGVPSAHVLATAEHDGLNEPNMRRARKIVEAQNDIVLLPSVTVACECVGSDTYKIDAGVFVSLATTDKPDGEFMSRTVKTYTVRIYRVEWDEELQSPFMEYIASDIATGDEPTAKDVKAWCADNDVDFNSVVWRAFEESEQAVTYYLALDDLLAYGEVVELDA